MIKWVFLSLLFLSNSYANLQKAPPAFKIKNRNAVFIDITKIQSKITYNLETKSAEVSSTISFRQDSFGAPIFDLIPAPTKVRLQNKDQTLKLFSLPQDTSSVRILNRELGPGNYEIMITNPLTKNVRYNNKGAKSAFWMSDLSDRKYLEQYLPVNLEYDQYKIDLEVQIIGTTKEHQIKTNGEIKTLAKNHFKVIYPRYFTASSVFFHLMPIKSFNEDNFIFRSIDGRDIPISIYGRSKLAGYTKKTKKVLKELENDYGPFPHPRIIIYASGFGGMEYCGATMTSFSALEHELTHSYFARGIMPARGNAGWVDEAIASWRDGGYSNHTMSQLRKSRMGGRSVYSRITARSAYTKGAKFLGYLDKRFKVKGGLKPFLKRFKDDRLFKPFFTKDFQSDLESYFGDDLSKEFDKYIYGLGKRFGKELEEQINPYHPKLNENQLYNLL